MGASTIARDITERKQIETAVQEVKETERQRIARDLHDGVLQDLSYAAMALEVTKLNAHKARPLRASSRKRSTPSEAPPRPCGPPFTICAWRTNWTSRFPGCWIPWWTGTARWPETKR